MADAAENTLGVAAPPSDVGAPEGATFSTRAADEARQASRRLQDIQDRIRIRAERSGVSTLPLEEASALSDTAVPDSGSRLSMGQNASRRENRERVQRAVQAQRTVQNLQRTVRAAARTARWVIAAAQAIGAILFNPFTWVILVLFIATVAAVYFSNPLHWLEGVKIFGAAILEPIKAFIWGGGGEDTAPRQNNPGTTTTSPQQQSPQSGGDQGSTDQGTTTSGKPYGPPAPQSSLPLAFQPTYA